jgi:Tfp pilus assembly protein PilF
MRLVRIFSSSFATLLATVLVVSLSAVVIKAQGGVGSTRGLPDAAGGIHSIQGRVYFPDGRRAGVGIIVKLDSNVSGSRSAGTDGDGSFNFNSLPAAEYSVEVDGGPDYDILKQSVTIYGTTGNVGVGRAPQTIQVDLHLRLRGAALAEAKRFEGVPKEALESYKKGMQFAQKGDRKKAVEQLNQAVTQYPKFGPALSDLGTLYLQLNEMSKLAETMEALLKLEPNDSRAHLNLGIALFNQKKFPEAESHLREAVKLRNTDPAAHYYLGMTLVSTRQYSDAEKELELAIGNGGENLPLAHKYLGGLYLSSKKNQQAADELEKYLKLDPKAADAERIRGTIKDLRGKQ